jgi:hypothetical protein
VARPLDTARSLARSLPVRAAGLALAAAGAAAASLPLLEVPGYELAEAGALLAVLVLAPWLGIAAARLEGAGNAAPRGPGAGPLRRPERILSAWLSASAIAGVLLAFLFAGAALRAALGPCRALLSAGFFPLLALPSALLGCAIAVAAAFVARGRPLLSAALYAATVAACLAWRLREVYLGPAAFVLDPLLGYFPGPLYDEALPIDARLLLARGEALGWAATIAAGAAALFGPAPQERGARLGLRAPFLLLAVGVLLLSATIVPRRSLMGGDARAAIADALGARRDGPRCTLHLPAEKPAAAAGELLAECEFHVADVAAALGIADPPRVTVFVYRSAEEKRRMVGAAGTDYTKPWLAEIHLGDAPLPHPVLRHEIVHAVASAIADGPLRVPARGGVAVSMGLVEGLAVALEEPRGAWTPHEWSRAARDLGYLPDLGRALGPAGFWSQAPARAYTAAGSFLGFLLARYGPGPIAAAYRSGDLAGALGRPLPELIADWQRTLDATAVPEQLAAAARARLSRPSIFERRCAREVALLSVAAGAAAGAGRSGEACALYAREAELTGSAAPFKARGDVLARAGDMEGARASYRDAAARAAEDDLALRGALARAEGDLAWREGDLAGAAAAWSRALEARPDRAEERLLQAKLAAIRDPALGAEARPYLLGIGDPAAALARLARVDRPLAAYLVGRALLARGERAAAGAELASAVAGDLPPAIALEARLALAEARCAPEPASVGILEREADRARLAAARRRCAFEATAAPTR